MAFLLGLCTARVGADLVPTITFYLVMTGIFAAMATVRLLDGDQASGTLEHFDVLPIPRWSAALQIAAGSVASILPLLALVVCVSAPGWMYARPANELLYRSALGAGLFTLMALPLLGTLLPLRHGMRWPGRLAAVIVLGLALRVGWEVLGACRYDDTMTMALNLGFGALFIGLTWWLLWTLGHFLGDGWSAQVTTRSIGGASWLAETLCPGRRRSAPDGWNPLLWRELTTDLPAVVAGFLLGVCYILSGIASERAWDGPASRATQACVFIVFWACMESSLRTSRDRLSGLWGDLALTPIPVGSILWSRLRGMVLQALAVSICWMALGFLAQSGVDRRQSEKLLMMGLGMPLLGGAAGVLAGFVSGTAGRGIVAAFSSIALLYIVAIVSWFPGLLIALLVVPQSNATAIVSVCGAILTLLGFCAVFFGSLIWGSMRGIRRTIADQRG